MNRDIVVAIIGCLHGELDRAYSLIESLEQKNNLKVDLVLCCGDFQSARNKSDLLSMAVPPKYRHMVNFSKYYFGDATAPIPTVFIGGNHESSNYLWEMPYGGWVARNIYYMGYSNVLNFGGYKIGGISGIYKKFDFEKGHHEKPPLNYNSIRSIYHIRRTEVEKMKKYPKNSLDILMSHDWPCNIWKYGDVDDLIRKKPFFREDIQNETIGCKELMQIINDCQPKIYACAHMHVHFTANVYHDEEEYAKTGGPRVYTSFMALDKALHHKKYLEIVTLGPPKGPRTLSYDPHWLALTKEYSPFFSCPFSTDTNGISIKQNQIDTVSNLFSNDLVIPPNFIQTQDPDILDSNSTTSQESKNEPNVQTLEFCEKLQIINPCLPLQVVKNPDQFDVDF